MWKHVPNAITVFRLGLAAAFPFVDARHRLSIVLVAGLSDWLDGVIARRFGAQSQFGAVMDGVADKAFLITVLMTWTMEGELGLWQVLLVTARDIAVGLVTSIVIAHREWGAFGKMSARMPGKLTTACVFLWFVALLVAWAEPARPVLFWAAGVCSAVAALDYSRCFLRGFRGRAQGA